MCKDYYEVFVTGHISEESGQLKWGIPSGLLHAYGYFSVFKMVNQSLETIFKSYNNFL